MNPFITFWEAGFTILKSVFISLILGFCLFLSDVEAQTFTDGYFNFPAPECFEEPQSGLFEMELLYETEIDIATYITPLVADIDNDGIVEIIAMTANGYSSDNSHTNPWRARDLAIFNGQTGELKRIIPTPFMPKWAPSPFAVADVTGDGYGEIIIATLGSNHNTAADRGKLICYDYLGNELWKTTNSYGINSPKSYGAPPGIADFNGDGIPEVYIYNEIYNAQTGDLLAEGGNNGIGMMIDFRSLAALANSVAADLTNSPGLELAAGRTVYEVTINNPFGVAGNSMNPINANFLVEGRTARDGFTGVADINLDGNLEVVVSTSLHGSPPKRTLYVWNPRSNELVAAVELLNAQPSQNRTGVPFIGDVDGNGFPNIGVCTPNRVEMFEYNGSTSLSRKWALTTSDVSGKTKLTMFDFNQNGNKEIVYRDETQLRIFDGSGNSPVLLTSRPSYSGTGVEGPIIADVSGNGSAEILVTSNNNNSNSRPFIGSIQVYHSNTDPWAPARSVWNQYSYFNVHIRDDLSIPTQQPNHGEEFFVDESPCPTTFENRPLNNFMVQSTFYDEYGCRVTPLPDAYIRIDSLVRNCSDPNEVVVYFTIGNQSADAALPSQTPVTFFNGSPHSFGIQLMTFIMPFAVPPNSERGPFSITLTNADQITWLYGVVNDDGSESPPVIFPITSISECDYTNNIDSIEVVDELVDIETSEIIYTCDPDEAGVIENTYETAAGCDSTHIITIEWQPSHDIYEEDWACNPQDTGLMVFEGMNQYGCDSTHTTQYNLAPTHDIIEENGSCNPTDTGTVITTYTNEFGCDSVHTVQTELWPTHEFFEEDYSCFPADTGLVVDMHTNTYGCDSVYYLRTYLLESSETFEFHESCNPADTATIVEEHLNEAGCDSIHYIVTELLPTDTIVELVSTTHPSDTGQVIEYHLNQHGCDSLHITITELEPSVYIPNAFSPNTDGINDEFRVYINVPAQIELMIFDRWGSKVYESRDPDIGWDGQFRGEPAPEGIYTFQLSVQFSNGSSDRFSGDLLLIR